MKINKFNILTVNSFLLSPILSMPFIILQLRKKNDTIVSLLFSLIIGFFSLRYVPSFSNDKVRYIERSELFADYSLGDLLLYFKAVNRPDYVFDLLNFTFSKASIDIKYFFFVITSLSVFLTFIASKKIVKSVTNSDFIYSNSSFFLILFSFSAINVLSGLRFFLAGSIFLWFLYFLYFKQMYLRAFLILLLAIATHFSYSLILVATIFAILNQNFKFPRVLLISSLVFFILPNSFLMNIFSLLSLPSGYLTKVEAYTLSETVYTDSSIILSLIRNSWYYFAIAFMLFYKSSTNDKFYILIVFLMVFINLTYSLPVVFSRYVTYARIVFAIYLVYLLLNNKNKKNVIIVFSFLALFSLSVYTDLFIVLRYNIERSYSIETMWSIYHIITEDNNLYNYLY
ncbi:MULTISPECIES: EpsG family protein [unclassified Psychrobacter]|uniref:EpsG family protein n=1 Tax=unclassified Psychrobacter TaxID=196806 RepID=UPI003F971412